MIALAASRRRSSGGVFSVPKKPDELLGQPAPNVLKLIKKRKHPAHKMISRPAQWLEPDRENTNKSMPEAPNA
jgi:hypothetical protein